MFAQPELRTIGQILADPAEITAFSGVHLTVPSSSGDQSTIGMQQGELTFLYEAALWRAQHPEDLTLRLRPLGLLALLRQQGDLDFYVLPNHVSLDDQKRDGKIARLGVLIVSQSSVHPHRELLEMSRESFETGWQKDATEVLAPTLPRLSEPQLRDDYPSEQY